MIKIGITGALASGKTTASKILSSRRGPLFNADKVVREIYKSNKFKFLIKKHFGINSQKEIKTNIKRLIFRNKNNIKTLEKIIHPMVRKKMKSFSLEYKNKKTLFYEIPLLIESKLTDFFDVIIFIKAKKQIRLRRFKSKKGDSKLFNLLNNKQMTDREKAKFCNYVVVNEKNKKVLKKKLLDIIKNYE